MSALTEEQIAIRDTVRSFAREEVAPLAVEIDEQQRFPVESWKRCAELGLLGITAPDEHGGSGLGLRELCIVGQELSAVCQSTSATVLHQADLVVDSLVRNGTEAQKAEYLPRLCDGSSIGCLAITEPGAGSDALGMRTRARRVGGGWVLSGSKAFITNGPVADLGLVYAKTGNLESREIGLFIVDMTTAGVSTGEKMDKMGWRGSETCELFFDDVFVPERNVLGGAGNGLRVLMSGLNSERVLMAAQAVGLAQGAFQAALAYAKERVQFGRRIGEFQLIRAKLADMYARIAAVSALVDQTVQSAETVGVEDLRLSASAAKVLAADLVMDVTAEAVQVLGGYGYIRDYHVERFMRDAKLFQIGGGTSEVLRDLMGRELVG